MSHDPVDRPPPPDDPKAALEDHLIAQAMEPYRAKLGPDELAGMRLFLRAFVKTHPTMQTMIARRLTEEALVELTKAAASGVHTRSSEASGVVSRDATRASSPPRPAVEASAVVAKDPDSGGRRKGAKGG